VKPATQTPFHMSGHDWRGTHLVLASAESQHVALEVGCGPVLLKGRSLVVKLHSADDVRLGSSGCSANLALEDRQREAKVFGEATTGRELLNGLDHLCVMATRHQILSTT
jgi:hypothetical protein